MNYSQRLPIAGLHKQTGLPYLPILQIDCLIFPLTECSKERMIPNSCTGFSYCEQCGHIKLDSYAG